ncbi:MAG: outer membrane beta-barrel protein [Prevotellaceae bacterium]|jgi:hypothetical protein|nr:outer membrane beta-barrel protein [Prevotellaceae bacterium]
MKKLFLIAALACASYTMQAQGIFVGGSLSAWGEKNSGVKSSTLTFLPEVGYSFGNNWHAGVVLGFGREKTGNQKENLFRFTPYAGYTFYQNEIASLFVEGAFSYLRTKPTGGSAQNGLEVGLSPGLSIKLSPKLSMRAHYGFLGYRKNGDDNGYGMRFDGESLAFGFHYAF